MKDQRARESIEIVSEDVNKSLAELEKTIQGIDDKYYKLEAELREFLQKSYCGLSCDINQKIGELYDYLGIKRIAQREHTLVKKTKK